ncbi:MAG TPA: polymer-forming cytoskeletal protein [Blastocatellia bacterium]|nr:polymer-forming cytoskeletal protein [Blastocatellia bacterium]
MKLVKGENGKSELGWIGHGIEITGDIAFSDRLQVDGRVSGKITSETGTLIIGESGQLTAKIDVGVCVVHGALNGNLTARTKVEIRRTGRVVGDVMTPVLLVEEGAIFNGVIKVGQEALGNRGVLEEVLPAADAEAQRAARRA